MLPTCIKSSMSQKLLSRNFALTVIVVVVTFTMSMLSSDLLKISGGLMRKQESNEIFTYSMIPSAWNEESSTSTKNSTSVNFHIGVQDIMSMERIQFDPAYKSPCWIGTKTNGPIADGRLHCLPYFYLMGVKKSGTSDLFKRLLRHPDFADTGHKEIQWLTRIRWRIKRRLVPCHDVKSVSCYIKHFDRAAVKIYHHRNYNTRNTTTNQLVTADGTPAHWHMHTHWTELPGNEGLTEPKYTNFHYLNHLSPKSKVVIIFRDPVTRAFSDFKFITRRYHELNNTPEVFHDHVVRLTSAYRECFRRHSMRSCVYNLTLMKHFLKNEVPAAMSFTAGFYVVYMRDLLDVFSSDRVHVVFTSEYSTDMENILNGVFHFLNMRKLPDQKMQSIINTTAKHGLDYAMLNKTRDLLYTFYEPYNHMMADFMNDERFLFPKPTL